MNKELVSWAATQLAKGKKNCDSRILETAQVILTRHKQQKKAKKRK